ncbi:MAG: DNA polymerase III subunit gamma/tau [Gemmataceae bacterium]|nr:DNA polymerase III subunit gamma/tau [Gemmataceae bacterium]
MAKKTKAPAAETPPEVGGEYTVVARRYRPQQFAELIGQESVAQALRNAIQTNRVAHAYLFTGVRGVGKTSVARIFAKALNCVKGPSPTPCDQCDICKAIAEGQDVDVQEIDGASNNGVENVRMLRNNVATLPQRAKYKIYIIDEVHMLSAGAFNALLKTLEEPPKHVKFFFATTNVEKIPLTILSRCQRFDFGGINTGRIVEHLKTIVKTEGMQADEEALRIVARRAGGSMRDAQSLLEQLLSFGSVKLTADAVHQILGTAADERVVEIAAAVLAKDATKALGLVAKCADEGLQIGELLDQLVDYWRGLMLLNCSGGEVGELNVADHHRETVKEQARALTLDTILAGIDILTSTKNRLRNTSHGQVLLEMAVVRLSRLDDLVPISQLSQWLSQPGSAPAQSPRPGVTSSVVSLADQSKKNGLATPSEGFRPGVNGSNSGPETRSIILDLSDANLYEVWNKVKSSAGIMLSGQVSRASVPAIIGPKTLVLRFPAEYNHAFEYCKDPKQSVILERSLREITGQEWSVRFEKAELSVAVATVAPPKSGRDRQQQALSTPLLARIVSHLEGRLLKLDEGFGEDSPDDEPEVEPEA